MADDKAQGIYSIADELRAIAIQGLHYADSAYDSDRYERVLKASAHLVSLLDGQPLANILSRFKDNSDHISPLIGTDSVVFRDGRMLLIKRHDNGLWATPGGLVEVGETLTSAALRELQEEVGLTGTITRLLGVFDSHIWKSQMKSHLYHVVFEVAAQEGTPVTTNEATDWGFFSADNLPELSPGHILRVPFLFRMMSGEIQAPYLDPPEIEAP